MKKLHKSTTDRVLAGVCGGVAEFFGIDSTLVRIAWAFTILFAGTGVWLYIICALIMPNGDMNVYNPPRSNPPTGNNGTGINSDGTDENNGWR